MKGLEKPYPSYLLPIYYNPEEYDELWSPMKQMLRLWIDQYFTKSKTARTFWSSYGLKHHFASEMRKHFPERGDFYVVNGAFKGAMLEAGFEPVDKTALNWEFKAYYRKTPKYPEIWPPVWQSDWFEVWPERRNGTYILP